MGRTPGERGNGRPPQGPPDDLSDLDRFGGGFSESTNGKAHGRPKGCASKAREDEPEEAFQNYYPSRKERKAGDDKEPKTTRVGYSLRHLENRLVELSGGWPKRIDDLLFAEGPDGRPLWLEKPAELFAWINRLVEPADWGWQDENRNRLVWAAGPGMVSEAQFYAALTHSAAAFSAIEPYPHFPPIANHYYMHANAGGGDDAALAELLARFSPATPIDADLLRAFFLSLLWGGPAGGRPAWLFTSADDDQGGRGVGTSTVVKMAARLVGGHIDLATGERMTDMITRLLTPDALQCRVVLLDNVKSLKFSWAELEALITNDTISGHRMYHGESRRPNTLTFCITLNGASLSRDLAQRCVVVKMARPKYSGTWEQKTIDLIERKRWQIIGDALAALAAPASELANHGRWGSWESGVLSRVERPDDCRELIGERQDEVDDDTTEADLVRAVFIQQLTTLLHAPATDVVWIPTRFAGQWCNEALGERRPIQKASSYLDSLSVPELRRSKRADFGGRGWEWRGTNAPPDASSVKLHDPMPPLGGGSAG